MAAVYKPELQEDNIKMRQVGVHWEYENVDFEEEVYVRLVSYEQLCEDYDAVIANMDEADEQIHDLKKERDNLIAENLNLQDRIKQLENKDL